MGMAKQGDIMPQYTWPCLRQQAPSYNWMGYDTLAQITDLPDAPPPGTCVPEVGVHEVTRSAVEAEPPLAPPGDDPRIES